MCFRFRFDAWSFLVVFSCVLYYILDIIEHAFWRHGQLQSANVKCEISSFSCIMVVRVHNNCQFIHYNMKCKIQAISACITEFKYCQSSFQYMIFTRHKNIKLFIFLQNLTNSLHIKGLILQKTRFVILQTYSLGSHCFALRSIHVFGRHFGFGYRKNIWHNYIPKRVW